MKKIMILGVVAVLLTFSLVLASCWYVCPGWGDCEVRTDADGHAYKDVTCDNGDCKATNLYENRFSVKSWHETCSCI